MSKGFYLALFFLVLLLASCNTQITPDKKKAELPDIFPDYKEVTIPLNIAPINFKMINEVDGVAVKIENKNGNSIFAKGKSHVEIPPLKWAKLLVESKGETLEFTVFAKENSEWVQYKGFSVTVSNDEVDYGIAYRLVAPGYEVYSKMGIYQRELTSFNEDAILENTLLEGSCVNCHSFRLTNPDDMSLHIRGKKGGTILKHKQEVKLLNTKTPKSISNYVYPYWHPEGNFQVYSLNNISQVFHESKEKRVEVIDSKSDIIVYDVNKNETLYCDKIMSQHSFETFPTFTADGKTLVFCSAKAKKMPDEYDQIKYNLCSISFEPNTGSFGEKVDTLFNAEIIDKSVAFPRPSPDGKYIMFTLIDYGNFSIWHKEADLYLLDVASGEVKAMDNANSEDTESYHSWSSNSRWCVFSSRRINGLYTRPYIAQIDENGNVGKAFLLPQENPDYYNDLLFSFNIPEFINKRVDLDVRTIEELANTTGTNVAQRE